MVQFHPWFKFCFPLFLSMVIYDNELKTKENKIELRIKLNHNITNEMKTVLMKKSLSFAHSR